MKVVLVRHAIAEEKREDLDDLKRKLTEEGKEKFQKLIPDLIEKLDSPDEREVVLWSSPATRALETAHILAEGLQISIHETYDFIYEGDFDSLSHELQSVDEGTTVIVVGHEPTLSEWTEQMSDEDVKIKKGEMLCFRVTDLSPLKADLQWVVTAK